jgi:hypothetical protein
MKQPIDIIVPVADITSVEDFNTTLVLVHLSVV